MTWNAQALGRGVLDAAPTWALPGWYHVAAAALAGEPSDLQFELDAPERGDVTEDRGAEAEAEARAGQVPPLRSALDSPGLDTRGRDVVPRVARACSTAISATDRCAQT